MKHFNKIVRNKNGFTLVELMITLAILLLVLTLCYQTFYYIYNSYDKSEEDWIVQQDVRTISDWIDKNTQTAYILEIYADKPTSFSTDDNFDYLYAVTGGVYFRKHNKTAGTFLAGETIGVNYSFDEVTPNALHYIITGNDLNKNKVYSVEGTVLILNIPEGKKINKYTTTGVSKDGTCIRFKTTAMESGIPGMIDIN